MSGFSIADLRDSLVRSLQGKCKRTRDGIISRAGDQHEHCGECVTQCEGRNLGFAGGLEVGRVWGGDGIELRWKCPMCTREVTQATTALFSMQDAENVASDPMCYSCRMAA